MGIGLKIEEANNKVLKGMLGAEPVWIDLKPAIEVVPGMKENMILHAGPPIEWEQICGVQRNGIIGGILHQGLAKTKEEAVSLIEQGKIEVAAANDHRVVGAGVGILCARMYVLVVKDKISGEEGYCFPVEGPYRGGLGGWGVYNEKIEKNLQLLENVLCPMLSKLLKDCGGINAKSIIAKGTQMGDESHSRQTAEGLLLINELMPYVVRMDIDREDMIQCVDFLTKTERFFHHIGMAAAMSILQSVSGIDYSTVVTALAGNGVEYGIKISALPDAWFTEPAPMIEGKYFSGQWGPDNAIPWLGDSCVVEAVGLGGFAAAAGPAVLQLRG
ncbi:MAG: DUF1116 domain-containing protein, partial [Candidatus Omnitrophica bacterium]|nr:DUF1116 domain-containing protein [Candidatus Omnitrophota bacterium]